MKYNRVAPTREVVERLCRGSIDMHAHNAPDPDVERRANALEMAYGMRETGQRGVVLKSFFYPTAPLTEMVKMVVPEVDTFGSVTIGYSCGGFNAGMIAEQARMGCKVVWMPAFDSYYFMKGIGMEGGYRLLDDDGKLLPEVVEVLKVIKEYDLVVCSGHIRFDEAYALFDKANQMGITKMVATHPLAFTPCRMTMEQVHTLADMGAYIEHVYGQCFPRLGGLDPQVYVDCVKEIGAERSIFSSDFAQNTDPMPSEGFRMGIGTMLQYGCTEEEMEWMVKKNPYKLLGLEYKE